MKKQYIKPAATAVSLLVEGMVADSLDVNKGVSGSNQGTNRRAWDCNDWTGGADDIDDEY